MKKIQCENCGSNLFEFNRERKVIRCQSCGTMYFYNDEKGTIVVKLDAGSVPLKKRSNNFKENLRSAFLFQNFSEDYDKARTLFQAVIFRNPSCYLGWWGLVRADNQNLDYIKAYKKGLDPSEYDKSEAYGKAIALAPANVRGMLMSKWKHYVHDYTRHMYRQNILELRRQREELKEIILRLNSEKKDLLRKKKNVIISYFTVFGAAFLVVLLMGGYYSWTVACSAMIAAVDIALYHDQFGVSCLLKTRYDSELDKVCETLNSRKQEYIRIPGKIRVISDQIREIDAIEDGYDPNEYDEFDEIDHLDDEADEPEYDYSDFSGNISNLIRRVSNGIY